MWQGNIVTTVATVLNYGIIVFLIVSVYRKQLEKAKHWKIAIAYIVGVFSFSITIAYLNEPLRISILPLGIWILYAILIRRNSWEKYRKYAWIGFGSNFIFLISTFITIPIHHWVFPQNEINTYIADVSEAYVLAIHPTAGSREMLQPDALHHIQLAKETQINSAEWHYDTAMVEPKERQEKFPYILLDAQPKWGSGYKPIIYIEQDGRGILITAEEKQFYFRTSQGILSEVAQHE